MASCMPTTMARCVMPVPPWGINQAFRTCADLCRLSQFLVHCSGPSGSPVNRMRCAPPSIQAAASAGLG